MKLFRYGDSGAEKPGLVAADGTLRDLSARLADIDGTTLAPDKLSELAGIDPTSLPVVEGSPRFGPPVSGIGKLIAIGLNYSDHAAETGQDMPAEPVIFMKATSAICGPNDHVMLPKNSRKGDWEVELGIIVGTEARYVSESDALDYVAGYCVVNDVSERELQLEGTGQWVKGKSADTFAPLGPYLVTKDDIPNPQNLRLWLEVDGHRYQDGSTATMVFSVAYLVSYASRFMSLQPGDVIATGTPPGVGLGQKPRCSSDPVIACGSGSRAWANRTRKSSPTWRRSPISGKFRVFSGPGRRVIDDRWAPGPSPRGLVVSTDWEDHRPWSH